ncbi:MAG: hydroxymyristoyl-ACP dehydratase [Solimonas sp.]
MNLDPQPLAIQVADENTVDIRLAVPAALPCFADHFPRGPMLPGVLQLGWAVHFARRQFGIDLPFRQAAQLKFQHPILPDSELTLRLTRGAGGDIAFRYSLPARTCSSGKLAFAAAA